MLYMEDENNVRPAWMPHKNDYRHLNLDEVQAIEDCDEAMLWVNDRITDMHTWLDGTDEPEHQRRLKRHISRAHFVKNQLLALKSDYWLEEKKEYKAFEERCANKARAERAARHQATLEAHAKMKASPEYQAEQALKHQRKLEVIAASNREDRAWQNEFRHMFIERWGAELWKEMAIEARNRVQAKQPLNEESGNE